MTNEFSQLNLHPELVQAVDALGYTTPTPVQSAIIPLMLEGHDVLAQSQTGSGKTAAFALPILNAFQPGQYLAQTLVLAPTRELAIQVTKFISDYGRFRDIRVLAVYGGQPYGPQIGRIKRGVDVVVGTPGRLLDLIKRKVLDLSNVKTVILDEADEMLSMGFIEDIETILKETPTVRQTALFSATLPTQIRRLADRYMRDPQSVTIERKQLTVDSVEQRYYLVNERDKMAALTRLFEVEEITSALIFARTRIKTGDLANELTLRGFPAEAINGDLSQDARIRVLNRFRGNQINVLVATDVAARGLDIDHISHVFNYDLPQDPELYVHRVGRTARAGKAGIAITFLSPSDQYRLRRIEKYTEQKITRSKLPTGDDIRTHREEQLLNQVTVWLRRGRCRREQELVEGLVAEGHDPVMVAAVALKLARAEEKQRPIAPINELKRVHNPRRRRNGKSANGKSLPGWSNGSHERGMVRLGLSKGKAHGIRPNDIVGTIAFHADIPGKSIGKIQIQQQNTLVDVPEQYVDQVLANAGAMKIHRQFIDLKRV